MKAIVQLGQRFVREEDGLAVTEYGLLLALVAVALIAAITTFRNNISTWFQGLSTTITSAR